MSFGYWLRQKKAKAKELARALSYWGEYISWLVFSTAKFKRFPIRVKRVLIVNYGALGDIFCSLLIAHNLKLSNPEIEFCISGDERSLSNVKSFENELGIRIIDDKKLIGERFDLVLLFSVIGKLKGVYGRLGFCVGNEYSSIGESKEFLTMKGISRKVAPRYFDRNKIRQEIRICREAGLRIDEPLARFNKKRTKGVENLLKKNKIKKFAIIHPSGKNFADIMGRAEIPALAWPLDRFSEVGDYLAEKGYNVILTGSKDERFISEKVKNGMKNKKKAINLAGELSIEELTDLVGRAKMLVSIDTSIVHIGEFVGTPVIALFGPTFPEEVAPYGKRNIVLHHPEKCIRDRGKGKCYGRRNIGMESISTEEVKKAIDKLS